MQGRKQEWIDVLLSYIPWALFRESDRPIKI
jgi:hypothetical protein